MLERGIYGKVEVIDGKFKGKIGLYTEDVQADGQQKALVYFMDMDGYKLIPYKKLSRIEDGKKN